MNEYELKNLIEKATKAIEDYKKGIIAKGIWQKELKESVGDFIEKSHVLNSAGRPCPSCNGTGRA